jgi:hypothetical protein
VEYVRAGLRLVPIPSGSKGPRTTGWNLEQNAIATEEQAVALNGSNIGIAHAWSGTCAIDLDDLSLARDWLSARKVDIDALLKRADAVQITSGRPNRAKLLYRLSDGVKLLPTIKPHGSGLELRCATRDGQRTAQDVLPPSIHPDTGKPYVWAGRGSWLKIPILPDSLLEAWRNEVERPTPSARARLGHAHVGADGTVPEGGRNDYLTSLAGVMRHRGMGESAIAAALLAENASKCDQPLPEDEVRRIVKSVMRYAPGEQHQSEEWPDPQSLDRDMAHPEPFPLGALPGLVGDAVREYQAYGQQPLAMVASSALAVVSLATQGLADVARDSMLSGPISLFFMTIAQSGERKSAADDALGAALDEWERERSDAMREAIKLNRAEIDAWESVRDGLKNAIKSATKKKPDDLGALQERLSAHALTQPKELVPLRLRYENVNPASLAHSMAIGHPSAALWSDEGGNVTGSQGMDKDSVLGFMAGLNRLWDGGEIHHDRKQATSVHLEGRRLTASLMMQRAVVSDLMKRTNGLARGSGFLARYLISEPASTMGDRPYKSPTEMQSLPAFHVRILELLRIKLPLDDQERLKPPVLKLSAEAFRLWRAYHDEVEAELRPFGAYKGIGDFAAKSADNAARIAGCLHVFSHGPSGVISADVMGHAVVVARWYLREALRVMDLLDEPQDWTDARSLDSWLATVGTAPTRDVLHRGPGALRNRLRRDAAIKVLEEMGRARVERDGKRSTLVRNPKLGK